LSSHECEPESHTDQGDRAVLNSRPKSFQSIARGILIAGLAGFASAAASAPASAQNIFDFFFNSARRPAPSSSVTAYADPQAEAVPAHSSDSGPRIEAGPAVSYCVRLCDGRFFPIQRSSATPVEVCNSFCPAAKTKIFSGSTIDHAVANDGARYTGLGNAFVYRTKVVPGCSCNGKDSFGLVNMKAAEDPTLRHGDVVATDDGFVAYSGNHKKTADNFTPINSASGVPAEARRDLARTRIAPAGTPTEPATNFDSASSGRDGNDRRAQLVR
jgi:hypothetical protein